MITQEDISLSIGALSLMFDHFDPSKGADQLSFKALESIQNYSMFSLDKVVLACILFKKAKLHPASPILEPLRTGDWQGETAPTLDDVLMRINFTDATWAMQCLATYRQANIYANYLAPLLQMVTTFVENATAPIAVLPYDHTLTSSEWEHYLAQFENDTGFTDSLEPIYIDTHLRKLVDHLQKFAHIDAHA